MINLQAANNAERATTSEREERAPGVRVEKVASKPVVSDPRYGANVSGTGGNVSAVLALRSSLWAPFLTSAGDRLSLIHI